MKNLFAALFLVVSATSTLFAQQITVTGEALVYAKPDKILINFGIETRDPQLLVAKTRNAEIWKKAAAALKESGVPDKDVQTDYLSIEPRYSDHQQMGNPVGYVARDLFVVTLSDPAKVEALISRMLEVGVNHVNGVEFQTTQFKQHRESARQLALVAAKEKAEKMAAALGCAIGKPTAIQETYSGGYHYFSSWSSWGGFGGHQGMSQNVIQDQRGSGGDDPRNLALGKISIRAGVSVTFQLKDGPAETKN